MKAFFLQIKGKDIGGNREPNKQQTRRNNQNNFKYYANLFFKYLPNKISNPVNKTPLFYGFFF